MCSFLALVKLKSRAAAVQQLLIAAFVVDGEVASISSERLADSRYIDTGDGTAVSDFTPEFTVLCLDTIFFLIEIY